MRSWSWYAPSYQQSPLWRIEGDAACPEHGTPDSPSRHGAWLRSSMMTRLLNRTGWHGCRMVTRILTFLALAARCCPDGMQGAGHAGSPRSLTGSSAAVTAA